MPACPRCGAAAGETARFCSACGAPLRGARRGRPGGRKIVTVMFADVSGFTALGRAPRPRVAPAGDEPLLRRDARGRRAPRRDRRQGHRRRDDGRSSASRSLHEDDAVRAARLQPRDARRARRRSTTRSSARWGERLRTHTGINTGEVVVGAGRRRRAGHLGDPVNVARRLQESAARGDILVGADHGAAAARARRLEPVDADAAQGQDGRRSRPGGSVDRRPGRRGRAGARARRPRATSSARCATRSTSVVAHRARPRR